MEVLSVVPSVEVRDDTVLRALFERAESLAPKGISAGGYVPTQTKSRKMRTNPGQSEPRR